jgi:hypothetical protein
MKEDTPDLATKCRQLLLKAHAAQISLNEPTVVCCRTCLCSRLGSRPDYGCASTHNLNAKITCYLNGTWIRPISSSLLSLSLSLHTTQSTPAGRHPPTEPAPAGTLYTPMGPPEHSTGENTRNPQVFYKHHPHRTRSTKHMKQEDTAVRATKCRLLLLIKAHAAPF